MVRARFVPPFVGKKEESTIAITFSNSFILTPDTKLIDKTKEGFAKNHNWASLGENG